MNNDKTHNSQGSATNDPRPGRHEVLKALGQASILNQLTGADVISGVYPNKFKGMVVESPRRSTRRSTWAMNIAGPFCFVKSNNTEALANQVSNLIALPVVIKTKRKVVFIKVLVGQGEKDRLISNEYRRQIKRDSHLGIAA
jgi:hypothetical protein